MAMPKHKLIKGNEKSGLFEYEVDKNKYLAEQNLENEKERILYKTQKPVFEKRLFDSGCFSQKGINWILNEIFSKGRGIGDLMLEAPLLSASEKKSYGINPRTKIGKPFFESLSEKGRLQPKPKEILRNIDLEIFHRISRAKSLNEFKKSGIKNVEIIDCGDERDCKAIKEYTKRLFEIGNVPSLPLQNCNAEYCRCMFTPNLDGLLG